MASDSKEDNARVVVAAAAHQRGYDSAMAHPSMGSSSPAPSSSSRGPVGMPSTDALMNTDYSGLSFDPNYKKPKGK